MAVDPGEKGEEGVLLGLAPPLFGSASFCDESRMAGKKSIKATYALHAIIFRSGKIIVLKKEKKIKLEVYFLVCTKWCNMQATYLLPMDHCSLNSPGSAPDKAVLGATAYPAPCAMQISHVERIFVRASLARATPQTVENKHMMLSSRVAKYRWVWHSQQEK